MRILDASANGTGLTVQLVKQTQDAYKRRYRKARNRGENRWADCYKAYAENLADLKWWVGNWKQLLWMTIGRKKSCGDQLLWRYQAILKPDAWVFAFGRFQRDFTGLCGNPSSWNYNALKRSRKVFFYCSWVGWHAQIRSVTLTKSRSVTISLHRLA